MKRFRKYFLFLTIFFCIGTFPLVGQPAETIPDFTLFRQDKSLFTSKNLDTQKLLLFVFFDVTCEHCRHAIQQINKKYPDLNNTFIHLVTLDPPEEVNDFLSKYGKNLTGKKNVMLFFDLKNEFIIKFKPRKYPSIFLYTPQRKLILYDDNPENLPKFFEQIKARSK
ncbi:MAG: redoxin domain-containing protein [Bacteroidales bacterium]|nr:redoxin domain-containing protein [Bacteroidales bacterium]